jgi:small subunit ribosomal protein S6
LLWLFEGQGSNITRHVQLFGRGVPAKLIQKEEVSLMRVYELLFIVNPKTEEADVEALITQLSDVATNQGAQVVNVNRMGRRRLAYPIQKFNEGYYVVITIEGTGAEIAEVERRMRVTDAVIRYLTIRVDEDLKRAEKFRARRAAQGAGAGGGRGRRGSATPRAEDESEEEGEE